MKACEKPAPDESRLEAAAHWHARLQETDLPIETWDEFVLWREVPENAAAFAQLEDALRMLDVSEMAGRSEHDAGDGARQACRRFALNPKGVLLAASAFVALSATLLIATGRQGHDLESYETALGEIRTIDLADGSHVTLNTDSRIDIDFTARRRNITLTEGQAYFDVAHDADRPFIVAAAESRTTALGTQFEVYAQPGQVSVTLVEGSVVVSEIKAATGIRGVLNALGQGDDSDKGHILAPGERATLVGDAPVRVEPADIETALKWREGRIEFRDMPLTEAVAELNRYSRRQIRIGDADIARERISGVFPVGDQEKFLSTLGLYLPIEVVEVGDTFIVDAKD